DPPLELPSKPVKTVPVAPCMAVQSEDGWLRLVGPEGIMGSWPFEIQQAEQRPEGVLLQAKDGSVLAFEPGKWESRSYLEIRTPVAPEVAFEEDWLVVGDARVPL
ncbi:MAG: hypothetical protein KC910_37000, partial [Candidatus Eremiobacteraeota bacterium]|nr:hypothetical protein [Candidatus Eremiobacteraeota bacterium]